MLGYCRLWREKLGVQLWEEGVKYVSPQRTYGKKRKTPYHRRPHRYEQPRFNDSLRGCNANASSCLYGKITPKVLSVSCSLDPSQSY